MRTLALRPEQTLADLHAAIQDAFAWDADHLYSFFLRGKAHDEDYEISGPEEDPFFGEMFDEAMQLLTGEEDEAGDEDEDDEDIEPLDATTAVLGHLGMRAGHTMLYYFDYGDGHEFDVTLAAVQPQAEPGDYPRLVEAQGAAPPRYDGDEDADDDEDWEEEEDL